MTIKAIETEYNGYRFRSRLEARWAVFLDALGVKYEYEPDGFVLPSGRRYLPDFRVKCYGTRGHIGKQKVANNGDLCRNCKYGRENSYAYQGDCSNKDVEWTGYSVACAKSDSENNNLCYACDGFELDDSCPFDLYIEVKGRMTQDDADRIREFAGSPFDEDGMFSEELACKMNPVLIVGDIPPEGGHADSRATGSYEPMNGIAIYPFNYETIDGDYFAAYPAARNKKFYLWGDDSNYVNAFDEAAVEDAYRKARQARFEFGETPVVPNGRQ